MTDNDNNSPHSWRFFRSGGLDQVRIESLQDLQALAGLDQKLWAALSCPTKGLEFDGQTLRYLDSDEDGRVRVPEVLSAVRWSLTMLRDTDALLRGDATLKLADIDTSHAEGAQLYASARQILINLDQPDADALTVGDSSDLSRIFADTRFNGDDVITPMSAGDDAPLAAMVSDIMKQSGETLDRCGLAGCSREQAVAFFAAAKTYVDWAARAEDDVTILPLGEATEAAVNAWQQMRAKVDDFFTRCRLAGYDGRAANALTPAEKDYEALAIHTLSRSGDELTDFPLATIAAGKPLPLVNGVNPAWADALMALRDLAVVPLLGARDELDLAAWSELSARLSPYLAWVADKQGEQVEPLGRDRVREILSDEAAVMALLDQDKALEQESNGIVAVDRLLHYQRDLMTLLNNFVSFRDFYSGKRKAIFQAGTLYIDGRSCDLCVRVDDVAKHSSLATLSRTYMLYCDCVRRDSGDRMQIVACMTAGDSDQLMVGRNGVFYDRLGNDWDATVSRIVDHPISIRQAFWAPYKRIGRMIGEQIEKFASARAKAVEDKAAANIAAAPATVAEPAKPPTAFDVGKFAGIFAAIGLAVGAIGTAIASVVTGFMSLLWWQMPLALVGALLLVSGPSMLIAWLKLRQRNLGPLLDATGWAVNTRAKINIPFGTTLTGMARLPEGAQRSLDDPFAEKKTPWGLYFVLLAILVALAVLVQRGVIG